MSSTLKVDLRRDVLALRSARVSLYFLLMLLQMLSMSRQMKPRRWPQLQVPKRTVTLEMCQLKEKLRSNTVSSNDLSLRLRRLQWLKSLKQLKKRCLVLICSNN
eukprot:RCo017103